MALDFETALAAAVSAAEEVNETAAAGEAISVDPDAVLFGDGSELDSMGLVNVVMAVEQHIGDQTGSDIVLASESAMSRKRSPYRSLRALAEYAVEVAAAEEAG